MSVKGFYINGEVQHYDYGSLDNKPVIGEDGLTDEIKQALLQCFRKVIYKDESGHVCYQELYDALYSTQKVLTSITAAYIQSGVVYTTDSLNDLRKDITVTAHYSDSSSSAVSDYTLSGDLTVGTSTITVHYGGLSATFDVNVTAVAGIYTIISNLTGCSTNNSSTTIEEGSSYNATITPNTGYTLSGATVHITMGEADMTGAYSNGTISIANVTGDITITVVAESKAVSSISALYVQSGPVYNTDTLDELKSDLVVTATYTDSTTATIPANEYTLSGTLSAGTSTITVSYSGYTTTFTVTVTQELNGLVDGTYPPASGAGTLTISNNAITGSSVASSYVYFFIPLKHQLSLKAGDVITYTPSNVIMETTATSGVYIRMKAGVDDNVFINPFRDPPLSKTFTLSEDVVATELRINGASIDNRTFTLSMSVNGEVVF